MSERGLQDLIEDAKGGGGDAVRLILERFGPQVRRSVGRKLSPALRARADSEDVLQSAMVAALANLEKFKYRGEAAFVGWLSTIAAQQVAQLARHHGAQRRALQREQRLSEAPHVQANLTSATQAAARSDDYTRLREAMGRLPEPDREVVRLRSLEEISFSEVAERLGMADQDAARYVYRRGLKRLGHLMSGSEAKQEKDGA